MGVSRVDFDGETLIDLTGDTVTPQSLLSGYSAHNKAGELIEGLAVIPTKVSELKNDSKFITETGDSSKTTVTFEQAVKRANVNSGDDLSTAFSKLSKFCEDLKPHAFSAPITNLFATVTGNSLDATMGKNLKDLHDANKNEINALNASLSRKVIPYTFNINATSITLTLIKRADILFINGRFQLKEAINMKSEIPILTISDTKLFPSYNSEIFKVHGYDKKNGDGHILADGTLKVRLTVGEGLSGDIFYINVAIPCY